MSSPTAATYAGLPKAYDHYNRTLFGGQLPRCLITFQRHKGAYGYFAPQRFRSTAPSPEVTDEIALNPQHIGERSARETHSTLVHEMAHLWQQHCGTPPKSGYHTREWAEKMKQVGLHPSTTGEPGGKETGPRVSHFIVEGGPFAKAFAELESKGLGELYTDAWAEDPERQKTRERKAASKTKFSCPTCEQNVWAKPTTRIRCDDCDELMEAA